MQKSPQELPVKAFFFERTVKAIFTRWG